METCLKVYRKARVLIGVTGLLMMLTACGGGGGGGGISTDASTDSTASTTSSDTTSSTSTTDTGTGADAGSGGDTGSGTVDVGVALGSASLGWQAPVERADGAPLLASDIRGYRIYYGTRSGEYDYSIDVNDAGTTSYVISDLPLDDYYFVLTTIDSDGRESGFSNEAIKQVQS